MIQTPQRIVNNFPQKSVYQLGETPNMLGEAYRPIGKQEFEFKEFLNDNKVEEVKYFKLNNFYIHFCYFCVFCSQAESLDVNASIHGNWTIDNAKSRLNQFIQSNKLKNIDYKYSFMGK